MNVVYIYHIHIHSSVNGHLGHFHVLAIVNSAAMNIRVHVPYLIIVFSGIYVQEWDCWIICQLSFILLNLHIGGSILMNLHSGCTN